VDSYNYIILAAQWEWPSQDWSLIGYKLWQYPRLGDPKLREAFYIHPNPSMTRPDLLTPPNGHWHNRWSNKGNELLREWVATPLTKDVHLYLKRAGTRPKGKGQGNRKGQGNSEV
jgi:hypothetical protein